MIAVPRVLADESCPLVDAPPAQFPALERVQRNVAAGGAHEDLFLRALAAGAAVNSSGENTDDGMLDVGVLDVAALAAWRAGLLAIREDALARLRRMLESGRQSVAAATLGLPADALREFTDRQREDRFWWPGRAARRGYVLAFGGFSGLGGAWVAPASEWRTLDERAGAFAVCAADEWWRLDADLWGGALRRMDAPTASDLGASGNATVVISPRTHLAWLHLREAA